MRISAVKRWMPALMLVGGVSLFASAPAHAFCATCYTAAMGAKGLAALKSGILILLVPTVILFSGLMLLIFRYRNSYPYWPSAASQMQPGALADSNLLAREELRDSASVLMPLPTHEGNRAAASRI